MIDVTIPMYVVDIAKILIILAILAIICCVVYMDILLTGGIYTIWSLISWCCYGIIFVIIFICGALSSPDSAVQVINITWSR
jgi:hypothetical protein